MDVNLTCSMTSGAIQHGVPTKVCRDFWRDRSPPVASHDDTPKSAIWMVPSSPNKMLPAFMSLRFQQINYSISGKKTVKMTTGIVDLLF